MEVSLSAALSAVDGLTEARARKDAADALYRDAETSSALTRYEEACATLETLCMLGDGGAPEARVLLATCLLNCALCFKRLGDPAGAARKAGLALGCGGLEDSPLREAKALFTRAAARQALAAAGGAKRAEGRRGAADGAALGEGWAHGAGVLGADADDGADEHELDDGVLLHAAAADLERAAALLEKVEAAGASWPESTASAPSPPPVDLPSSGFVDLRAPRTAAQAPQPPPPQPPPPPPPSAAAEADTATARKMLREVYRARKAVRDATRALKTARESRIRSRMDSGLAEALASGGGAGEPAPPAAAVTGAAAVPTAPISSTKLARAPAPAPSKMSVDYSRFDSIGNEADDAEEAAAAEMARLAAAQQRVQQVERSVHASIANNKMGEAEAALRQLAAAEGEEQRSKLKSTKAALASAMEAGLGQSDDAVAEVQAAMAALQTQMNKT